MSEPKSAQMHFNKIFKAILCGLYLLRKKIFLPSFYISEWDCHAKFIPVKKCYF